MLFNISGARNHAAEIIDMAFEMLDSIITVKNPTNNEKLKIRIGQLNIMIEAICKFIWHLL
jgi:hypothetical protein